MAADHLRVFRSSSILGLHDFEILGALDGQVLHPWEGASGAKLARPFLLIQTFAIATGFGGEYPQGARLFLDNFKWCWSQARRSRSGSGRLRAAFQGAARRIRWHLKIDPDDEQELCGGPSVSALAILMEDQQASLVWCGGQEALLSKNAQVVGRTSPHTVRAWNKDGRRANPKQDGNNGLFHSINGDRRPHISCVRWKLPEAGGITSIGYRFPKAVCPSDVMALRDGKSIPEGLGYCVLEWTWP